MNGPFHMVCFFHPWTISNHYSSQLLLPLFELWVEEKPRISSGKMGSFPRFIVLCTVIFLMKPVFPQQYYDKTNCYAKSQISGSNYLCTVRISQCQAYIAYRAQEGFMSLSSISALFDLDPNKLLKLNNMTEAESKSIQLGREVIVPVSCNCPDRFSRAIIMYNLSLSDSAAGVACGAFQGMAKQQSLEEENPGLGGDDTNPDNVVDTAIRVPILCACPSADQKINGVEYLVTYSVMEKDHIHMIGLKFGVTEQVIREANRLRSFEAIFPGTTLLIPVMGVPSLNLDVVSSPDPAPSPPREVIPVGKVSPDEPKPTRLKSYVIIVVSALTVIILTITVYVLCLRLWKMSEHRSFQPLSSPRSSQLPSFSPDFLDGMSKLKHSQSLISFSLDELRLATEDFSDSCVTGSAVYCGRIGSSCVAIEEMSSREAANHVIDILTRTNHLNVVKLEGCCFGTKSYLVFEAAGNGSLRDCLSRPKIAMQLAWRTRMQIAFDVAVGLHYVHHCTKPSYSHRNINSRNVLLTADWRAKISGFRLAKPVKCTEEKEEMKWTDTVIVGKKGYLAPEYYNYGQGSGKVDIFAFGVVLVELLSGKEACAEGKMLRDFVRFVTDIGLEASLGCLEKLKEFMDPALEGEYEVSEAICLAFLAKACVEENPNDRPTMNDVLKALSRIA